ncbi:type VII secretion target [Plantactinospora sp. CA-294935]|uniref:type VII secretion target n=1 Tax=Plantactinospora sp. CA-294935 TaxID=3240012 RepID=UPI003D8EDB2B
MSDIRLPTAEVRKHAQMVDEAGRMCGEAAAGAEYVSLHDEVYGILCSPLFLPIIDPLSDHALTEIRNGADATTHLAELLRALADNVDITDGAAATRIREAGGR